MKRQVLLYTLCLAFAASAAAQGGQTTSMTSKNGHEILPQAGDWCIGMDAVPVLDFALNVVNIGANTGNTSQHPGYVSGFNNTVVGKYFDSATMAYRARVSLNSNSQRTNMFFDDPLDTSSADPGELEDNMSTRTTAITIGGGIEHRRGHNRLQGFYGAEAWLGFARSSTSNTYGLDWSADSDAYIQANYGPTRTLSSNSGATFGIGARGFGGVEYFAAPKISIGAEFGLGLGVQMTGRGKSEVESWDGSAVVVTETEGSSSTSILGFGMDTGVSQAGLLSGGSAALFILFHI